MTDIHLLCTLTHLTTPAQVKETKVKCCLTPTCSVGNLHAQEYSLEKKVHSNMATSQIPTAQGGGDLNGSAISNEYDTHPQQPPHIKKEEAGWRRIVRNFTPSWFAVNMGTGIVSILIRSLPYTTSWLPHVAHAFFALNVSLFLVFTAITVARYVLYPEIWTVMVNHPGQSLFLGTFPMGLASE